MWARVTRFVSLDDSRVVVPGAGRSRCRITTSAYHTFRIARRGLLCEVVTANAPLASRKRVVWPNAQKLGGQSLRLAQSQGVEPVDDGGGWWCFDLVFCAGRLAQIGRCRVGGSGVCDSFVS